MTNYYQIHHLLIASSLHFPELKQVSPQKANVTLTEGFVPKSLGETKGEILVDEIDYESSDKELLLIIKEVGHLLINDQSIVFERNEGVDDATLRLYLLGSGIGFLLLKRGIFPFHGSTVVTRSGAAMFIGDSGLGKSTTAAKFLKEGHCILSDDMSVVRFEAENLPLVYPSIQRIKLWDDSILALQHKEATYTPIMPNWEKKHLYLNGKFATKPTPLKAIYLLTLSEESNVQIDALEILPKIYILMKNTFREMGVKILGKEKEHFLFCTKVAQSIPIKALKRPVGCFDIDGLYNEVMIDLESLAIQEEIINENV